MKFYLTFIVLLCLQGTSMAFYQPNYKEIPSAEAIPIIDGHLHLFKNVDADEVRRRFKKHNVIKAVWFPRKFRARASEGVYKGQADDFANENLDLGYVLVGLQRGMLHKEKFGTSNWTGPHKKWKKWISKNTQKVLDKERHGFGELIIRHYSYNSGKGERDYPIDSVVFRDLLDASTVTKSPLVFHAEGEKHVVSELLNILPNYPSANVVWAHACGRSNPVLVRQWLKENPNLFCDLANMTDTGHYGSLWPRHGDWTFKLEDNGVINPDWVKVLEEYPSRFYIGSDINEEGGWNNLIWEERIIRFRKLLSQVSPNTREWLAWKTAETLFSGNN